MADYSVTNKKEKWKKNITSKKKKTRESMDFSSRFALTGDRGKRGSTAFNEDDYHGIFIRVRRVRSFSRSVKFRDNECLSRHWNVTCHIFVRHRVCVCVCSKSPLLSEREGSKNRCLAFQRIAPDNAYRVSVARRPFRNSDERMEKFTAPCLRFKRNLELPRRGFFENTEYSVLSRYRVNFQRNLSPKRFFDATFARNDLIVEQTVLTIRRSNCHCQEPPTSSRRAISRIYKMFVWAIHDFSVHTSTLDA